MFHFLLTTGFVFIALRGMSLLSILQTTRPCAVGEQGPASSWGLVKMGIFIYYSK